MRMIISLARSSALPLLRTGSAWLSILLFCAACGPLPPPGGGPTGGGGGGALPEPPPKPDRMAGLAAFETVRAVFQHPRCQNCHPDGDVPLQGDEGRPHAMNVRRGPRGEGMAGAECTACHVANPPASYGRNIPPSAAKAWHMPPPELKLVFVGLAPRALCEQIKDPARNGGKDMPALRHHLDDPLVTWAWAPGVGRAAIPTPRQALLAAWDTWAAADAPCPE